MAAWLMFNLVRTGDPFNFGAAPRRSSRSTAYKMKKPNDMKETIDNLFKESEELLEKCNDLTKAMDALRNVRPSETALIDDMTTEYNGYVEQRHKVLDAITALQRVCKHEKWEYTGHDSHYSYEKCVVCRLERKT